MYPNDCIKVLQLFLKNGQDVNAIGANGQSILIWFVLYKRVEVIRYLLNNTEINLNIQLIHNLKIEKVQGKKGETALAIANRENMEAIAKILNEVTTFNNCTQSCFKKLIVQHSFFCCCCEKAEKMFLHYFVN